MEGDGRLSEENNSRIWRIRKVVRLLSFCLFLVFSVCLVLSSIMILFPPHFLFLFSALFSLFVVCFSILFTPSIALFFSLRPLFSLLEVFLALLHLFAFLFLFLVLFLMIWNLSMPLSLLSSFFPILLFCLFPCSFYVRTYTSFEELLSDFVSRSLHPGDLKPALARDLNALIQPVRDHFLHDPHAKEIADAVKKTKIKWMMGLVIVLCWYSLILISLFRCSDAMRRYPLDDMLCFGSHSWSEGSSSRFFCLFSARLVDTELWREERAHIRPDFSPRSAFMPVQSLGEKTRGDLSSDSSSQKREAREGQAKSRDGRGGKKKRRLEKKTRNNQQKRSSEEEKENGCLTSRITH